MTTRRESTKTEVNINDHTRGSGIQDEKFIPQLSFFSSLISTTSTLSSYTQLLFLLQIAERISKSDSNSPQLMIPVSIPSIIYSFFIMFILKTESATTYRDQGSYVFRPLFKKIFQRLKFCWRLLNVVSLIIKQLYFLPQINLLIKFSIFSHILPIKFIPSPLILKYQPPPLNPFSSIILKHSHKLIVQLFYRQMYCAKTITVICIDKEDILPEQQFRPDNSLEIQTWRNEKNWDQQNYDEIASHLQKVLKWKLIALSVNKISKPYPLKQILSGSLIFLKELVLSSNSITSIELLSRVDAPQIEKIELKNNEISNAASLRKVQSGKIRVLGLNNNKLNEIGNFIPETNWNRLQFIELESWNHKSQHLSVKNLLKLPSQQNYTFQLDIMSLPRISQPKITQSLHKKYSQCTQVKIWDQKYIICEAITQSYL